MHARVDQFVVENEIAALGQRRIKRGVGGKAAAEKERAFGTEKPRRLGFERFVLLRIAAKQARAAGADGDAARDRR